MSSKSSTKSQLPNKSAWARGPPQNTAAISATSTPTRSQSPAPQQTHSRRPSTLGQGVSVKDGVALPRTVKTTATPVTFGSINDASAPISSSPSPAVSPPTAASVKSDVVKSFGSVPAQQPNGSINASTTAAPSASSAGAAASSSSANPTPPPASSAPKLDKKDILKMFQNPPSASSSSTPPPSNDSGNRSSPAPAVSSQPSTSSTSTTSGSSNQPPSFPPFVPSGSRPPQSSSSSQPPRSPVYSRQMPNGSGPRPPQGGPANAAAGGPASPRLAPPNMQGPGAPPGAPPQGAPQMHPGMPPQPMPGWGYYPGMDPNQPYYVPYGWYVPPMPMPGHPGAPAPPGAHHPPHHPHQPHPNQHPGPPGTPHGPPHALPLSPRPPPPNALPPGTPTTPHAALHTLPHHPGGPHHGPHHGPHGHHSNQGSISVTSPPGTPASASASITSPNSASSKLNASSSAFVPGGAGNRASKIVFKNADGSEVDFTAIAKQSRGDASPGPKSATFPRQPSPAPASQNGSAAGTPKRKSIRLESEEQRKARLDLEAKEKEAKEAEVRKQKEREEQERKDREAKEQKEREREERKKKEEEERKEKERRKKEEDEREEQARKKKIEEERERKKREAEEERERKKVEEAERAKREEEDKIRKQKEKEERKKRDEERKKQEEEDRKKREAEEEIARQEREAAEAKRKVEEAERAKVEAEKKAAEEAAAKAKAEEDAAIKLTEEPEEGEIKETESPIAETAPNSASRDPKSGLRINTGLDGPRRGPRPDPLDLTGAKGPFTGPGALPSALATARNIESLESVQYPEGILSPKPELNKNVKDGFGFRYDRDFLLQFMKLCTEKPASLPPLHVLGLEPSGDQPSHHMTRTSSGRHGRSASGAISARQASIGLGIQGGGKFPPSGAQPFGTMGNFAGSGSKLSSEDRFAQSQRAASMSGGAFSAGRPTGMTRTASQGGRDRTRSKRGEKRGEGNKAPSNLGPGGSSAPTFAEPVAPLVASSNAWSARARAGATQDADSPEIVDRKVKSLLNKLTMEKFDSISDQIIQWANKSEKEKDGRTLIQVIRLVFEKATDEATWSEMYARLCRKMMERISPLVQDDGIRNPEGKPITGGQLFRKYLLNRCQEDFERGWVNKEATAAAAATKALEDEALKQAHDKQDTDEPVLYSDEYYAAQKAKRQGLGLIKFIGELFKLQMLTERIMHECVKKLLGNVDNPEEEEIESLCKLLTTVGQSLDTPKARAHMDVYFSRMKELTKSPNVSSRMQFMLQDVLELRERKWVSRQAVAAPSTIAQVHENAAKEKAVAEKEAYSRQISMSRGGSRRGGDRGDFAAVGPDGWAVAGAGPPRAPSKAGDLSKFGQINKSTPMTFGPTSVFAGKNKEGKRDSISRTNSSQNMFSMLQASEAGEAAPSKAPEPQRKRLVLQPRTVPTEGDAAVPKSPSESSVSEEGEAEEDAGGMSEEAAEAKVKEDIKEFFAIRSIDEAEVYWTALPPAHHHRLVDKLLSQAVEAKEQDAQLVADLFKAIVSKELCSADAFEQGFVNIANFIEDIAIDAPKAVTYFGMIVKAVDLDDEHRRRLADKASEGHEDEGKEEYAERILKAIS